MEEELARAIEIVADQLNITVEHIYSTFVSAQPVIGALSIGSTMAVVISTAVFAMVAYKVAKSYVTDGSGDWENDDSPGLCCLFAFFATFVAAFVFSVLADVVNVAVLKILCPEYTAIREILTLVMRG